MATAAPPAPATSTATPAPASAPASTQAPSHAPMGAPGASGEATRAGDFALPGVIPDSPDFDPAGKRDRKPIKPIRTHQLPKSATADAPAETVAEGEAALDKGVTEAATGEFKFNGRTYRTQAEAENAYRTLDGELQQTKARESAAVLSAHSWKNYADNLGKAQPATEAKPADVPKGLEAVVGEMFDDSPTAKETWEIADQLYNSHGPLAAHHFLLKNAISKLIPAIKSELSREMAPFHEFQSYTGQLSQAGELFQHAAKAVDGAGALAYPELGDESAAETIGNLWTSLPIEQSQRFTPRALHLAVMTYRDMVARGEVSSATPPAGASVVEPPAPGETVAGKMVARAVDRARGAAPLSSGTDRNVTRPGEDTSERSFKRGIQEAGRLLTMRGADGREINLGISE